MNHLLMIMNIQLSWFLSLSSSSTTFLIAVPLFDIVVNNMGSIDVVKAIVVTILATSCTASFIATTVSVVTSREVSTVYSREATSRQNGFKKLARTKLTRNIHSPIAAHSSRRSIG